MKFITQICFAAIVFFLVGAKPALAQEEAENNIFGIHIMGEHDLKDAASLVNSSGGQWGYVTFVIRQDERNHQRWAEAFKQMSELKLIPIVRIATDMREDGSWAKPTKEQAINWVDFLNSLPWPTKLKRVVLFNEPNHSKEWGKEISPEEYASIARHYWEELKKADSNFRVLPAALDLSASNGSETMDAKDFFERMSRHDEYIFTIFDAWNSHSYPNPGFSGSAYDTGRKSIRGFEWELDFLSRYWLKDTTPVYITETGWIFNSSATEKYKMAYDNAWNHPNIKAVTPFLLNYTSAPFDKFSWKDPKTNAYRPQYEEIQKIPKTSGNPDIS